MFAGQGGTAGRTGRPGHTAACAARGSAELKEKTVTDSNLLVLLVEDSGSMRKMELSILKKLGYANVLQAENGGEAVEIIKGGQTPGLIISDWNMPQMSGLELLKWVRASEAHKGIPFIMATAQVEKTQVEKAGAAGVNCLITKPFSPEELKLQIEAALSGQTLSPGGIGTRQPQLGPDGKLQLNMAHIQITDHLVLGVIKHKIESGEYSPQRFELNTLRMAGWNPVQKALEEGSIDGAFVLAPIAMDLFSYGVPLKLLMFAHKNGSIMVRSAKGDYQEPGAEFFKDSAFYIPHLLSVHHMLAHRFFGSIGLKAGVAGEGEVDVRFEVVPPIKMPELLASSEKASGYLVAEPLGSKAVALGIAQRQFLSGQVWPNHPCCVAVFRDEVVQGHRDAVQEFCGLMANAGKFAAENPGPAAEIAVKFLDPEGALGLKAQVLNKVLTEPDGITTDDLYPVKEDLDQMQQYMSRTMGFGQIIDLDAFVDTSFAQQACQGEAAACPSPAMLYPGGALVVGGMVDMDEKLGQAGIKETCQVASADEARSLLSQSSCRLVVADWEAGGLELLNWVRNNQETADLPFVMVVGKDDKEAILKSVKAKANNFVTKEQSPDEMASKLNKLLD